MLRAGRFRPGRRAIWAAVLCLVPLACVGAPYLQPVDHAAWLRALDTLEAHMARHYANLDWMVAHRGLDLPALSRTTADRLRSARVRFQAEDALGDFISAFRDPHLRLRRLTPDADGRGDRNGSGASASDCGSLGYEDRRYAFRFPFDSAAGWTPITDAPFAAGTVPTRAGLLGVVRIAHFGEDGYRSVCATVGAGTDARDTQLRVRGALQHRLAGILQAFSNLGVRMVLVDLTGNGGGSEWVVDAARLFTARPVVRTATPVREPPCDRTPIWRGEAVCGLFGATEDVTVPGLGAWAGPLAILVDGGTASASEDFVVRLRESGVARVLGERTNGAGCGYVDGGAPARLVSIGLEVLMPNCARFTRDGRNEIEGLAPDVDVPIRAGSAEERLGALFRAIETPSGPT